MIFIVITAIIIYFVTIAWSWHNLGFIEKNKKVAFIVIGTLIMYIITLIVFQISKNGINYQNAQMKNDVQNILVIIFTGLNSVIVMPSMGKILDKINEDEIEKNDVIKRIIILSIVFIVCLIIESGYMKDTQQGILEIYRSYING